MVKRNLFFFFFLNTFKQNLFLPPYKIEHCRYYWNLEFGFWTMGIFFCSYSFMWPIIENIGIRIPQTTLLQKFFFYYLLIIIVVVVLVGVGSNQTWIPLPLLLSCYAWSYVLINIIHGRSIYICTYACPIVTCMHIFVCEIHHIHIHAILRHS